MSAVKYPYIFVITYGRSGSTLLQGLLNAIPGYCIRGENNNVVNAYKLIHERLSLAHKKFSQIGRTPADPWYGIDGFKEDRHLDALRHLALAQILQPPEDTRCIGFKEIRYAPNMVGDLSAYLDFMRKLFPGAGFIFNSRNLDSVIASGWWKNQANPREYLEAFEANMRTAFEKHSAHSCWVHYDDYVADPSALQGLFDFLGEPFDLSLVMDTLATRHSG